MTPERIAELRELAENYKAGHIWAVGNACRDAIPELLDELEATQNACQMSVAISGWHRKRADSLAAQVAMLRETLEFGRKNDEIVTRVLAETEFAATTWLKAHNRAFVAEVNRMAEQDIAAGNPVTGAHHRALERCLAELE